VGKLNATNSGPSREACVSLDEAHASDVQILPKDSAWGNRKQWKFEEIILGEYEQFPPGRFAPSRMTGM
jgi:hypothetical protein